LEFKTDNLKIRLKLYFQYRYLYKIDLNLFVYHLSGLKSSAVGLQIK